MSEYCSVATHVWAQWPKQKLIHYLLICLAACLLWIIDPGSEDILGKYSISAGPYNVKGLLESSELVLGFRLESGLG